MFDLLLRYAVSEDGALHAEKFYRTVSEEFAATRPAFRWRHLVALGRVTGERAVRLAGWRNAGLACPRVDRQWARLSETRLRLARRTRQSKSMAARACVCRLL